MHLRVQDRKTTDYLNGDRAHKSGVQFSQPVQFVDHPTDLRIVLAVKQEVQHIEDIELPKCAIPRRFPLRRLSLESSEIRRHWQCLLISRRLVETGEANFSCRTPSAQAIAIAVASGSASNTAISLCTFRRQVESSFRA
jgi:hypothetical protein